MTLIRRTIHVVFASFIAFVVSSTIMSVTEGGPMGFLMFSICLVSAVGLIASSVTACIAYIVGD